MRTGKALEKAGKNILKFVLKFIVKSKEISSSQIYPEDIRHVLIIRQDRKIGNLILTTPLIEYTAKVFPNAKIDVLIAKSLEVLCKNNPFINKIYLFDHRSYIKNPFKFLALVSKLRKNRYAVAIESSHPGGASFLNGFVTYLSGAVFRIGFENGMGSIFTNVHVYPDESKHYYKIQQDLVNSLTKEKSYFKPKIFIDEKKNKQFKNDLLQKFNLKKSDKIIGIWTGARHNKRWDLDNFKKVYEKLSMENNFTPLLVCGVEEENIFKKLNDEKRKVIKFTSLENLKYFISACDAFICGDTGPLHCAYALNVPTIGIFLQNNYLFYGYADSEQNFIIRLDDPEIMITKTLNSVRSIFSGV